MAGVCDGECSGLCDAECQGTCTGECVLGANVLVDCGAAATCKGGCDGTATAPKCEGALTPPACDLDADCLTGCEGLGAFGAECTPPVVKLFGPSSATLAATLEANLPAGPSS